MPPEIKVPAKVREGAKAMLHQRLARLVRQCKRGAPPAMIAFDARLVLLAADMLAPGANAMHEAERAADQARRDFGVCLHPECEDDATPESINRDCRCAKHMAEMDAEHAEIEAELVAMEDDDAQA